MPGPSPLPTSPAGSNFIPRREFQKSAPVPSTYALLAFNGPNIIRMSHFPGRVVEIMRSALESRGILRNVIERKHTQTLVLVGKPWSSPKSLASETLVVEVLSVALAQGFHFLSLIDYAKEAGDILSLVFSRPQLSQDVTLVPTAGMSAKTHVPFALSFVSDTVVRVVSPPLNLTPSILQSVRKSWPRGVVKERKIGNNSYEFKLKGYGIFAEDHFQEDSLSHVMSILPSLAETGFSLLTSLSFAPGRSNSKDIWIMVGMSDALPSPYENRSLPNMLSPFPSTTHFRKASLDGRPQRDSEHRQPAKSDFVRTHRRIATTPGAVVSPESSDSSLGVTTDGRRRAASDANEKIIAFADSDAVSWHSDVGSEENAPSLLPPQSRNNSDRSGSPRLVTPPMNPQVVSTPDDKAHSQYITIEEAPDIRATQVIYATPPPPPLSPTLSSEGVKIPGAFPR